VANYGFFDPELSPKSWFDPELTPEGWFDVELIAESEVEIFQPRLVIHDQAVIRKSTW
jgi:hypothetical protein